MKPTKGLLASSLGDCAPFMREPSPFMRHAPEPKEKIMSRCMSVSVKRPSALVSLLIALMLALAFTGCASPPEEERLAAKAAKDAALAAGADKYAATNFDAAMQLWRTADSEV